MKDYFLLFHSLFFLQLLSKIGSQKAGQCGVPGEPVYGSYTPVKEVYNTLDEITYKCNEGYFLLGSATRKCRREENWSEEIPFCLMSNDTTTTDIVSKISTHGGTLNDIVVSQENLEDLTDQNLETFLHIPMFREILIHLNETEKWVLAGLRISLNSTGNIVVKVNDENKCRRTGNNTDQINLTFKCQSVKTTLISISYTNIKRNVRFFGLQIFLKPDDFKCKTLDRPLNGNITEDGEKYKYTCKLGYSLGIGNSEANCKRKLKKMPIPRCILTESHPDKHGNIDWQIIGCSIAGGVFLCCFGLIIFIFLRKLKRVSNKRMKIRRSQLPSTLFVSLNNENCSIRLHSSSENVPDILEEIYSKPCEFGPSSSSLGLPRAVSSGSHIYAEPNYDAITNDVQVENEIYAPSNSIPRR